MRENPTLVLPEIWLLPTLFFNFMSASVVSPLPLMCAVAFFLV